MSLTATTLPVWLSAELFSSSCIDLLCRIATFGRWLSAMQYFAWVDGQWQYLIRIHAVEWFLFIFYLKLAMTSRYHNVTNSPLALCEGYLHTVVIIYICIYIYIWRIWCNLDMVSPCFSRLYILCKYYGTHSVYGLNIFYCKRAWQPFLYAWRLSYSVSRQLSDC